MREYKLFGTLEVTENGVPVELTKSKLGCAILAYAILMKEAQRRDVAGLLWDAASAKHALTNLRSVLRRLRDQLTDVDVKRQTLSFAPEEGAMVDVYRVDEALNDASIDMAQLDAALRLYRGDLLEDFYVDDSFGFNEWLTVIRPEWRQRVVEGYRRLCVLYESAEKYTEGIDAANRWIALDELDEEAYRTGMRMLVGSGRRAAALRLLDTCTRRLKAELGVAPEPETVALGDRIRDMEPTEDLSPVTTAHPIAHLLPEQDQLAEVGELPPNSSIPFLRNDDFLGRYDALLQLADALLHHEAMASPITPAAVITGIGGMGKTQLAVEFAYRYGRFFPGGVYWLSFADGGNVAEEVVRVSGMEGMRLFREAEKLTMEEKIGRFQTACQEMTPRLLIFDNCEEEQLLSDWLPVSGGCRVVVTSRRAEWSRELGVETLPLKTLTNEQGIQFLTRLAPHIGADTAGEIASAVGELPLALHMAGSFLARYRRMSGTQYLRQLETLSLAHPSLKGYGLTSSPTDHNLNIAGTFAINLAQLDSAEEIEQIAASLLTQAAWFAPGESLPRAILLQTVLENPNEIMAELHAEDALGRLIELGFVTIENRTDISLHRLIADFVRETLPQTGAQAVVVKTMNRLLWEVVRERPNYAVLPFSAAHLRFVVENSLEHGELETLQLAYYLLCHLVAVRDVNGVQQLYEWLLPQVRAGSSRLLEAKVEYLRGMVHEEWHEFQLALSQFELAAAALQKANQPDAVLSAAVDSGRAVMMTLLQSAEPAESIIERTRNAMATLEIPAEHLSIILGRLSQTYALRADYLEAAIMANQAVDVLENAYPNEQYVETILFFSHVGATQGYQGNFGEARTAFMKAMAVAESLFDNDNNRIVVNVLGNLGVLEWRTGDFEQARYYFERGYVACEQLFGGADNLKFANAINDVGEVLCKLGQYEEAQEYHQRALGMRRRIFGDQHHETLRSLAMVGEVTLRRGEPTVAKEIFAKRA